MNDAGMAGTTAGANTANRKQLIKSICGELDAIDEGMATLRVRAKEIKKRVKDDLDMKVADFGLMRRIYLMEKAAQDSIMDTLREGLDALGVAWPTESSTATWIDPEAT